MQAHAWASNSISDNGPPKDQGCSHGKGAHIAVPTTLATWVVQHVLAIPRQEVMLT